MARLRKLTEKQPKARQISAYDEDWAPIKRAAKQAGRHLSKFLISSTKSARPPANPVHLIRIKGWPRWRPRTRSFRASFVRDDPPGRGIAAGCAGSGNKVSTGARNRERPFPPVTARLPPRSRYSSLIST